MPRYTPTYRLPAFDQTDKVRDLAQIDYDRSLAIEQILANEGRPPLASDLPALIERLNALESTPRSVQFAGSQAVAIATLTHVEKLAQSQPADGRPAFVLGNDAGVVRLGPGAYDIKVCGNWATRPSAAKRAFMGIQTAVTGGTSSDWRASTDVEQTAMVAASALVPTGQTCDVQINAFNDALATTFTATLIINKVQ